jgi:hypothetical protein
MDEKFVNVQIPIDLFKRIEHRIKEEGTESAADYIIKTLEKKMMEESLETEKISENEEEKIKERLKALGYMD